MSRTNNVIILTIKQLRGSNKTIKIDQHELGSVLYNKVYKDFNIIQQNENHIYPLIHFTKKIDCNRKIKDQGLKNYDTLFLYFKPLEFAKPCSCIVKDINDCYFCTEYSTILFTVCGHQCLCDFCGEIYVQEKSYYFEEGIPCPRCYVINRIILKDETILWKSCISK